MYLICPLKGLCDIVGNSIESVQIWYSFYELLVGVVETDAALTTSHCNYYVQNFVELKKIMPVSGEQVPF